MGKTPRLNPRLQTLRDANTARRAADLTRRTSDARSAAARRPARTEAVPFIGGVQADPSKSLSECQQFHILGGGAAPAPRPDVPEIDLGDPIYQQAPRMRVLPQPRRIGFFEGILNKAAAYGRKFLFPAKYNAAQQLYPRMTAFTLFMGKHDKDIIGTLIRPVYNVYDWARQLRRAFK
ncbi:MAG: hypothetical protein KKB81_07785 [Candidatus Margulisbacteria bacterium]|nr:hypothetical protein [Candidatus Margulisiibacteriota bacterium]MBU1021250.1 hypothetical protein [Candidatus Margulisiibacteriota bacterium]MBU1729855.1 hypothetical protein [Candidatus Margulisiibacteriota bacterium]MBU1955356.1 hypothetical protein [Candidatus Margulisiibacteriota bacterium]